MPLMLKIQDENGEIQTIREITVHSQEKKRYAGVPAMEYDCTLVLHGQSIRVWLIYYQTENRWVINLKPLKVFVYVVLLDHIFSQ